MKHSKHTSKQNFYEKYKYYKRRYLQLKEKIYNAMNNTFTYPEKTIISKNSKTKNLIISFAGRGFYNVGHQRFEFMNFFKQYESDNDFVFFIDKKDSWYHEGLNNDTSNIDESVKYLDNIIKQKKYKKIIFTGTSMGGYAAILFGSLCENVTDVIAFFPQTILVDAINKDYSDLKKVINKKTKYLLICDEKIEVNDAHHISECLNINKFDNVSIQNQKFNMKELRDEAELNKIFDNVIS